MRRDLIELLRCPFSAAPLDLEIHEADGDEIDTAILRGPVTDFPLVGGIAVLRGGDEGVVERLRRGDHDGAAAMAIVRDLPLSRLGEVVPLLGGLRPTRALARWLEARRQRSTIERGRAVLAPFPSDPDPLLKLAMVDNRRSNPEGYRYFRYRLGLPRHLVALGCLAGAAPGGEPVIEVGCGAGHLTWQIAELLEPRAVLGLERELYLLWIARHQLAPRASFVCGDARVLPVRSDAFSLAVAVDVLSFVTEKAAAVREMDRVLVPGGGLVLTSLINSRAEHEYRGEPLSPEQWAALVVGHDHRLYGDDTLLDRYLARSGPPSEADPVSTPAKTVTLLAGDAALAAVGHHWTAWPHAIGRLGPHPLLAPVSSSADEVRLAPRWPSPGFARDNPGVDRYLSEPVRLTRAAIDDARAGRSSVAVDELVARVALLGYPNRYAPDPWSLVESES
jgi:SAM-dependent methyltransferase